MSIPFSHIDGDACGTWREGGRAHARGVRPRAPDAPWHFRVLTSRLRGRRARASAPPAALGDTKAAWHGPLAGCSPAKASRPAARTTTDEMTAREIGPMAMRPLQVSRALKSSGVASKCLSLAWTKKVLEASKTSLAAPLLVALLGFTTCCSGELRPSATRCCSPRKDVRFVGYLSGSGLTRGPPRNRFWEMHGGEGVAARRGGLGATAAAIA